MPTLLQINTVINTGSTGRIAEEIGQIAISHGWKSYIAYSRDERPSKSNKIRIGSDIDMFLHGIQTRIFDNHGLASKRATRRFIKQIEQINPDIIHLHNIHGYYLNDKILVDYLASIREKVIWTHQDCGPFTGNCCYFTSVQCDRWKRDCFDCPQTKSYPGSIWLDRSKDNHIEKKESFGKVDSLTLVPVSDWLGKIATQSFLGKNKINRIYNGIDTSIFFPRGNKEVLYERYGIESNFLVLGVANVWSTRKGLKDFMLLSELLSDDSKIILVGLTRKQIISMPKNIIGIEKTENINQLAEIYSAADIFINPTWEDNFPTTNLEAMACGTPIITYKTGGSIEAVTEETGFVVEQGDVENLFNVIKIGRASCRERVYVLG